MGLFDRHALATRAQSISKRVQAISSGYRTFARLGALFFLALAFGHHAWRLSAAESLNSWKRANPPSDGAWKIALQSAGYQRLVHPKTETRLTRSMPALVDQEGAISVWAAMDEDGSPLWIAQIPPSDQSGEIRYYFIGEPREIPTPGQWTELGAGWPAMEAFVHAASLRKRRPNPPPIRKKAPLDPREIRF